MIGAVFVVRELGRSGEANEGRGESQLEHVHGLGIDPRDGALYAGSHYGLFRAGDSSLEGPIADRVQDFMGFTVAGPGHFLASGHPGEGQGGPHSLGLLESTDGGQTWATRSLEGEADFHALEYRHETVYGVNAMTGEFMVSSDLVTWESRSNEPMVDIAISPSDADTLLGTTQAGLVVSVDGGRTFEVVPGVPLLLLVDWAEDGSVVGITPSGEVYVGEGGLTGFARAGSVDGQPEALVVENASTIYVATNGKLLNSQDGGETFSSSPHP